ncbi:uncharacterized protein LOC134281626 [Saccostrea cucullata]|uniref:uncharacterized protein LOC134281626 n=1 Tax=Saccostrea cuccullata TaxID=36930 RepID=UPI002ED2D76A
MFNLVIHSLMGIFFLAVAGRRHTSLSYRNFNLRLVYHPNHEKVIYDGHTLKTSEIFRENHKYDDSNFKNYGGTNGKWKDQRNKVKQKDFNEIERHIKPPDVKHKVPDVKVRVRNRRGGGMMSQMSLGMGALADKSLIYGPRPLTSGNIPGSGQSGSGQSLGMSSTSSGPFANKGMSQSMFPAGLSNRGDGLPSGLSNGGTGMSPFPGSASVGGSMRGGASQTPFNMAMLSMRSQADLSPSMGGMSMNSAGADSLMGGLFNKNKENSDSGNLEKKIVFGDTVSIQYVNGKIIVPKSWSIEKVRALQAQIMSGHGSSHSSNSYTNGATPSHIHTGSHSNHRIPGNSHTGQVCPQVTPDCPQSCVEFSNQGCPVCSCGSDICPAFPAGCQRGRVRIDKDGCPVCVSKHTDENWYNEIWN